MKLTKEQKIQKKNETFKKRRINYDKWSRRIPRYGVRLVLLSCIGIMIYFSYDLIKQYQSSDQWVKVTGPAQANIPVNMFYLSRSEKQKFADYLKIKNRIWDEQAKDFKPEATNSNMKKLKKEFQENQLKDSFEKEYQMIIQFYDLREQYYKIVHSREVSSSLKDVNEFLTKSNQILSPYLLDTNQQQFVNQMYENCVELSKDYNKVIQIQSILNSMLITKDNHYMLKSSAKRSQLNQIVSLSDQLIYKWDFVTQLKNYMLNPIQKELTNVEKLESQFKAYEEDEKTHKDFQQFLEQYKNADKAIKENTVEYKSFIGDDVQKIKDWAKENDLNVEVQSIPSTKVNNQIIYQRPSANDYKRIVKKSTITVTVSKNQSNNSSNSNSTPVRPIIDNDDEDLPIYEGSD